MGTVPKPAGKGKERPERTFDREALDARVALIQALIPRACAWRTKRWWSPSAFPCKGRESSSGSRQRGIDSRIIN